MANGSVMAVASRVTGIQWKDLNTTEHKVKG